MTIFSIGGCILIALPAPSFLIGGLNPVIYVFGYIGYLYVIVSCIVYAVSGRNRGN